MRLVVADDSVLLREGLVRLLEEGASMFWATPAEDVPIAVELRRRPQ